MVHFFLKDLKMKRSTDPHVPIKWGCVEISVCITSSYSDATCKVDAMMNNGILTGNWQQLSICTVTCCLWYKYEAVAPIRRCEEPASAPGLRNISYNRKLALKQTSSITNQGSLMWTPRQRWRQLLEGEVAQDVPTERYAAGKQINDSRRAQAQDLKSTFRMELKTIPQGTATAPSC